jgi:hypothetical protein
LEFDAYRTNSHPRLDRAGTKLSYCNGEIGAGSRNITPYMVWAYKGPRWVAHTLQQLDAFRAETERRWEEPREQANGIADQRRKQRLGSLVELGEQERNRMRGEFAQKLFQELASFFLSNVASSYRKKEAQSERGRYVEDADQDDTG